MLGNAKALLFPISWAEPFGLVMIESMACGTPVIAFDEGSVPEIIDHGRSGFIVSSVEEAISSVKKIHHIDRKDCRSIFEKKFSATRMAKDYIALFEKLVENDTAALTGNSKMKYG